MNVKEYKDKKEKGLAEIVKAGGGFACAVKKYDPDDGEELTPEITSISIDTLNKEVKVLQAAIDDIAVIITDIEALTKVEE